MQHINGERREKDKVVKGIIERKKVDER
jgi:hypothetical protein